MLLLLHLIKNKMKKLKKLYKEMLERYEYLETLETTAETEPADTVAMNFRLVKSFFFIINIINRLYNY